MDLKNTRAGLVKAAQKIVADAKTANRELTEDELADVQAKSEEIKGLTARIDRAEKAAAFEAEFSSVAVDEEAPAQETHAPAAKSLGEHVVKTAKGLKAARSSNGIGFQSTEFKAATGVAGSYATIDQTPANAPGTNRRPTVASAFSTGTISGNVISYIEYGAPVGSVGAVAEGTTKPKVEYPTTLKTETLKKIAGLTDVTDEMIEDEEYVATQINTKLVNDLLLEEENQLLNGSGTGANVLGVRNRSGVVQIASASTADDIDSVFRAKASVHGLSGTPADHVVIHPDDYVTIRTQKDANGQYLNGGALTGSYGTAYVEEPRLANLVTIQSYSQPRGKVLVGAFKTATLYRKGGVRVDRSTENKDNFENNTVTLRAEERIALAVPEAHAFAEITLYVEPATTS